jgi:hypothetical protein
MSSEDTKPVLTTYYKTPSISGGHAEKTTLHTKNAIQSRYSISMAKRRQGVLKCF